MPMTKEQLKTAAMELDPTEREALAEELLLSITPAERDALDEAWLAEIKRRDATADASGIPGKPVDEVIARLRKSIQS